MKQTILSRAFSAVLPALALMLPTAAPAQSYPAKPVSLVVTVPAGGSIDAVARFIAADLGPALGQPVLVVNRVGAGGNIAAEYVAKSPPDGYTLMITSSSTLVVNPFVYKTMPFDAEKSFAPIAMTSRQNFILAVHPKLNVSNLNEFVALLKSQPGQLNFASSGSGTLPHLACVLLGTQTGTTSTHVPFTGIAPALNALLSGQVDFMCDSATTIPHIRAGKVKAFAVIGPKRLASLPEVATFREQGMPAMEAASGWYGVFAPAGTSPQVVQRLNREIVRIMNQPATMEKVVAMGLENATSTPEELAAAVRDDLKRFAPIVKQANVTVQ